MNNAFPLRQLIVTAIILALGVWGYFALLNLKKEAPQHSKARPVPLVEAQTVALQAVAITVESQGTVQAQREVRLVSEVAGRVTWVSHRLQNGTLVEKNELLLKLDPTDYEAAVAKAKADVLSAQLNQKDRIARYHPDSLTVKQAAAQTEAAEKALAQAKNDLSNTQIVAPFAGAIRNKAADVGQYVGVGSALFELTGTDQAEVRLPMTGNDMNLLIVAAEQNQLDLPAMLTAKVGSKTAAWPARVTRIEAAVDDHTRVFYVVATVDRPYAQAEHPLSLGLFVNAVIDAPPVQDALVLPRQALHKEEADKQEHVFVIDAESRLQKRSVDVMRTEGEFVVIAGGLQNGERVAITRLPQMYSGMLVDIQESP